MNEFEEPDEPDAEDLTVDEMLNQERPERYDLDDQDWMEPVVRKERDRLLGGDDIEQVVEDFARKFVHTREGVATQQLNNVLRGFKEGRLPLGFGQGDDWKTLYLSKLMAPLMIGRDKVRFGVATPEDFDEWVAEKIRAGEREQERRAEAIDGARALAAVLRQQHVARVEDYRRPEPQPDED